MTMNQVAFNQQDFDAVANHAIAQTNLVLKQQVLQTVQEVVSDPNHFSEDTTVVTRPKMNVLDAISMAVSFETAQDLESFILVLRGAWQTQQRLNGAFTPIEPAKFIEPDSKPLDDDSCYRISAPQIKSNKRRGAKINPNSKASLVRKAIIAYLETKGNNTIVRQEALLACKDLVSINGSKVNDQDVTNFLSDRRVFIKIPSGYQYIGEPKTPLEVVENQE